HFQAAYWHWSFFVGPAEDIRQGGWLLWDLPSWYGFGSILLVALLPTVSAWESMYFLNAAALCFSAVLIYLVLRALRPASIGWLFASTLTTAGVFLLSGLSHDITGPQLWPSATAFRFVWVYVLLSILWWGYRRHLRGKATGFILPLGTTTWIAGMMWSFDSAIYSSAIWLPAFCLLVWERTESALPVRRRLVLVAAALAVPLAALVVVGVAIAGYYGLATGHLPDVSAYYECAWAFGSLFRNSFYKGSVGMWLLLLVFCAASTAVVSLFRRASPWALT